MALDHEAAVTAPSLLTALPDTVVVADARGRIAYVNPHVRVLLGYATAAVLGQPLEVLMPERFRRGHDGDYSRFLATGEGELAGRTTQLPALHARGHEVTVDVTLAMVPPPDGAGPEEAGVVAVLRDASTTILLERQLMVSRYLAATLRVTAALTEARDADVAFRDLLPTLCTELDWDTATLWQPDRTTGSLSHVGTWTAPDQEPGALHAASRAQRFRRGTGLPGLVWTRRSPVAVGNLWEDPTFLRAEAARRVGGPAARRDAAAQPAALTPAGHPRRRAGRPLPARRRRRTRRRGHLRRHAAARRPLAGAHRRRLRHRCRGRGRHGADPAHRPGGREPGGRDDRGPGR